MTVADLRRAPFFGSWNGNRDRLIEEQLTEERVLELLREAGVLDDEGDEA